MCEAFLKQECSDFFEAQSAGLEPGKLNPLVVEAMAEAGLDISGHATKSVFDLWKTGAIFQYVIAVCSSEASEKCPIFPGVTERLHWPFDDPAKVTGTQEEKLEKVRRIRDEIRGQIKQFCEEHCREEVPV